MKIEPPLEIFGNSLTCAAHQADVIRLDILMQYGGIYLDIEGPPSFFWPMYQDPAPLWGRAVGLKARLSNWRHYFAIRRRSYCVHLWEQLWWDPFLRELDFAYFKSNRNNFASLFGKYAKNRF